MWPPVWEAAVHLAVAGGIFDGIFLCCPFSPLDVLDEIWDVIESVSEGFLINSTLLSVIIYRNINTRHYLYPILYSIFKHSL